MTVDFKNPHDEQEEIPSYEQPHIDDAGTSQSHPYTCLSCSLAFTDTASQREHYATDLHRYNSKRRVAGLGPVSLELYNEKVLSSRVEPTEETVAGRLSCKACNKTFNTAATQATHLLSKKHKEAVFRAASAVKVSDLVSPPSPPTAGEPKEDLTMEEALDVAVADTSDPVPSTSSAAPTPAPVAAPVLESSGDPKLDLLIAKRILAAPPVAPTTCLFCSHASASCKESAAHMRVAHSFVIPEEEYLVDLEGLLRRLGEEVGTWNVCIFCGKGYGGNINLDSEGQSEEEMAKKASKGVEAVRNHMKSKSHCKLPYNTESQRLDLADFYDFRPSYPDYVSRKQRKALASGKAASTDEWEDLEGDGETADEEGLEVVYEDLSDSDDEELPESEITYGDSSYELVLPSGARIGNKAHKHIFKQNLAPHLGQNPFKPSAHSSPHTAYRPSPHSATLLSLVPAMHKDKSHSRPLYESGLIPAKGAGVGGNGDVIRARNKGEAKEANKSVRNFTELKARARQEFIRGVKANSQEHYRDHLLQ